MTAPDLMSAPDLTTAPDLVTISCPLCHTEAPALTDRALAGGADWVCPQCTQCWTATRLATVAAYAAYCAQRGATA
jgi:hypothetical protein